MTTHSKHPRPGLMTSLRSLVAVALLGSAGLLSVATSSQPPVIEQVNPAMGDSSVATDQPLEVVFERPVDPASATTESVRLRRLSDDTILEATIERAEGNRRLILRPSARLEAATDYSLELDLETLRSEDGEAYTGLRYDGASESVWETSGVLNVPFTTRRELTVARAFLQADPSEIWIYFSEPVNAASLTLESVSVERGADGERLAVDLRYSEAENRLRVIPLAPLAAEGTYRLRLSAAITTMSGAPLGGGAGDSLELDATSERLR